MIGILMTLIALSLIIMIHEFGHFIVAKKKNLLVTDFSIGFGPKIFSFKKGETTYAVRWILFGGYVMMANTDVPQFISDRGVIKQPVQRARFATVKKPIYVPFERTYQGLSGWWKVALAIAGPVMNVILGFALMFILHNVYGLAFFVNDWFMDGVKMCTYVVDTLIGLFTGATDSGNLSGPIGIVTGGGSFIEQGLGQFIGFCAMISLNLAVLNLMPFPPFDGSKILFGIYEGITGRQVNKKFEESITSFFVMIILAFFIYITFKDIIRL